MKRSFLRALSLLLCAVMLICSLPLTNVIYSMGKAQAASAGTGETAAEWNVGDVCYFGYYPQSKVTDNTVLTALNSLSLTWVSYKYYSGNGNFGSMSRGDWMKYAEVSYNGNRYRAVTFSAYRPLRTFDPESQDSGNQLKAGYYTGVIYWFKYEPIKWRVLDPSEGIIISDNILDSQPISDTCYGLGIKYSNYSKTIYDNNYEMSSIREWLNDELCNMAFSSDEKNIIKTTKVENKCTGDPVDYSSGTTYDKVFFLSWTEYRNYFPVSGFCTATGYSQGSDYAFSQGLAKNNYWHLRTAVDYSYLHYSVNENGVGQRNTSITDVNTSSIGVRPAIAVDLSSALVKQDKECHDCDHSAGVETLLAVAPTCTGEGFSGDVRCKKCGKFLSYGKVLNPIGHKWDKCISNNDGTHTQTCLNDPSHKNTTACCFSTAASTAAAGEYTHTCSLCGYSYTDKNKYAAGDNVYFGSYPQTRVNDGALIENLRAQIKSWTFYNYYVGTTTDTSQGIDLAAKTSISECMKYTDVEYDGSRYRGVYISQYRPYNSCLLSSAATSFQDTSGFITGVIYWYKFEPLRWKVIDSSKGLILCDDPIDSQPFEDLLYTSDNRIYYGDQDHTHYANNYAYSSIRVWLNKDFRNSAFSDDEISLVSNTVLDNSGAVEKYNCESTTDKIFLLSLNEFKQYESYIDEPNETDYCKINGSSKYSSLLSRTPGSESEDPVHFYMNNEGLNFGTTGSLVDLTYFYICPALCLGSSLSSVPLVCDVDGHKPGAPVSNNDGTHTAVCKYCSHTETTACDFGDWQIVTAPTVASKGLKTRTCKVCGYTESQDIAQLTISLDKTSAGMTVYDTLQLSALLSADAGDQKVSWTSDKPETAAVSDTGLVTAVGAGSAVITASAAGAKAECAVTVKEYHPAAPVFTTDITGATAYRVGDKTAPIVFEASVTDGGALTYQWYRNTKASQDGAQPIAGETGASYIPSAAEAGDTYYFVTATNTNHGLTTTSHSGYRNIAVTVGAGLNELTYSFANCNRDFGYAMNYRLPYEAYKYIFGDTLYASLLFYYEGYWSGNCFGMSSTSLLFNNSTSGMAAGDFSSTAAYPIGLKVTDTNTGMSMSLRQFIEYMQVSQFDQSIQDFKQAHMNDLDSLSTAVRSYELTGIEPVIVLIRGPGGGHAIVGYKLARINADTTYLYVYDCNFPNTTRYITLKTDSAGNYVSWYYRVNDNEDWGTGFSGSSITYSRYSDIINVWNSRKGKMDKNRYLLGMNTLNAKIMDGSGKVVAELVNGELRTDNKDIYLMQSTALTSDNTQGGSTTPLVWLPSDKYTVVSTDKDPKLDISVLGSDRQVDVSAGAGQVTIDAAASGTGTARIAGAKGQAVSVKVSSSVKDYVQISGSAASDTVNASLSESSVSASGIKNAAVSVNGKSAQTYTVDYDANGGSGAPAQQIKAQGITLALSADKPVRDGYTFLGWAAKNDAKTAEYQPGGEYKTDASVTLFAVWQKNEVPTKPETTTQKPETTTQKSEATTKTTDAFIGGDIDLDGAVTAADARLALRTAVGLDVPTVKLLNAADVDFDGYVTAADARLILRAAIGLEELKKMP